MLVTAPVVTGETPTRQPGVTEVVAAGDETDAGDAPRRPGVAAPEGPLPTVRVTPYVDLTTPPLPPITDMADATGHADVVLAFVLAGAEESCRPTWGGTTPLTDPAIAARVAGLKAHGGTVTVSSGGALGDYLESACPDAPSLARAYATALDAVGTDHLDVDVETDRGRTVSPQRIADALAILQRERGTRISLTVQVEGESEGLSTDAHDLVTRATRAGVAARVNLMVMNFSYQGAWADAMIGAARTAETQLEGIWPGSDPAEVRRRTAVTFMLGRNDMDMTTTPADARAVVDDARARGYGAVGFWALARDNGSCPGTRDEADDCSGIAQAPWEFTRIAQGFTAPT
ncbi:glycoside hydrolase family 18 protein [Actinomycetospora sp. C-140]